ncbi:MAG TPA: hypothetical protein VHT24_10650 [Pseudacidobacterium sp.]|jgi:hypothetical protein|nr:hypothetical protein [Pseudacidobacterium sp.]
MRLWRGREFPVFEGKWACSPACLQQMLEAAVLREVHDGNEAPVMHQHRVPLGLMLLSQGHITHEQLRAALEHQKKPGSGRLGEWLVRQKIIDEDRVVRALGAQWGCPVLSAEQFNPSAMVPVLPRLLADSYGALPLRLAGRHLLYIAFENRIDPCVTFALERISGLKVEACLVRDSEFRRSHAELLRASFPKTRLLEASSLRGVALAMTAMIEERKPVKARLVRMHNYFWLRLWCNSAVEEAINPLPAVDEVEDMICSFSTVE